VYVDATLRQSDRGTPEQRLKGKSTWRVFGHLLEWEDVSVFEFTEATGLIFKTTRETKKNPYDSHVNKRLLEMFDIGRLPNVLSRNYLKNAISLVDDVRNHWCHVDNAAILRNPAKYLSAIRFLVSPGCANKPAILQKIDELASEAGLSLVSPQNLPPH